MRRRIFRFVNLPLVYIGAAVFCLARLVPPSAATAANAINIAAWFLIIAGVVGYVYSKKD